MSDVIVRITAPHFCVGLLFRNQVVVEAAPIVKYMRGWNGAAVEAYVKKKRWKAEIINAPEINAGTV